MKDGCQAIGLNWDETGLYSQGFGDLEVFRAEMAETQVRKRLRASEAWAVRLREPGGCR